MLRRAGNSHMTQLLFQREKRLCTEFGVWKTVTVSQVSCAMILLSCCLSSLIHCLLSSCTQLFDSWYLFNSVRESHALCAWSLVSLDIHCAQQHHRVRIRTFSLNIAIGSGAQNCMGTTHDAWCVANLKPRLDRTIFRVQEKEIW